MLDDYVPIFPYAHRRIEAAIEFYQKLGIKNISLSAHGCGAHMSMSYLDKIGDKAISSFVGIGMGATDYQQKLVKPYPLATLKIPVLDIFAQNDFAGVLRLAKIRKVFVTYNCNFQIFQHVKNFDLSQLALQIFSYQYLFYIFLLDQS